MLYPQHDFLNPKTSSYSRGSINLFYKWCKKEGVTSNNPFEEIKPTDILDELPICSKEDLKSLIKFIKNKESNPVEAMILGLILFYGFEVKELIYSEIETSENILKINVFKRPRSYGHRTAKRDLELFLPKEPKWFLELQKRYILNWNLIYSKLKKPNEYKPLILIPSGIHNRSISRKTLRELIVSATTSAAGRMIPLQILKTTSGHIHTLGGDGSLLTQLGWSRAQAFKYTWIPKKYY